MEGHVGSVHPSWGRVLAFSGADSTVGTAPEVPDGVVVANFSSRKALQTNDFREKHHSLAFLYLRFAVAC